jgi:hypothetical protein
VVRNVKKEKKKLTHSLSSFTSRKKSTVIACLCWPRPYRRLHIWDFFSIFIAQHAEVPLIHIGSVEVVRDASSGRERRRGGSERYAEKGEGTLIKTTELNTKINFQ